MITIEHIRRRVVSISEHPKMFCGTPQAAHGELVAYLTVWWALSYNVTLDDAARHIWDKIGSVTAHVRREGCQRSLLCDEQTFPEHTVSFAAFRENSKRLLREIGVGE